MAVEVDGWSWSRSESSSAAVTQLISASLYMFFRLDCSKIKGRSVLIIVLKNTVKNKLTSTKVNSQVKKKQLFPDSAGMA